MLPFATTGCEVPRGERWADPPGTRPETSQAAGTAPQAELAPLPTALNDPLRSASEAAEPSPSRYPASANEVMSGRPAAAPITVSADDAKNVRSSSVAEQQLYILTALSEQGHASKEAIEQLRGIFSASEWLSFGNPQTSRPSMTRRLCRERREIAQLHPADPSCGRPNMVPIYDAGSETVRDARVCIDQFEFPNIECEYPVVWVRSSEAALICAALGKRLCDAHEWEGACAGSLRPVEEEYPWDSMPKSVQQSDRRQRRLWMEYEHNRTREVRWAYGTVRDHSRCATGAGKDERCNVVDWGTCGSNTYPAGAFPQCVSPLGIYDQHGNAAEHMNLPLVPEELTSHSGLGWTEMKGSWFIFQSKETHPDDCRWRARSWHTTRITDGNSHRNYHLGFRCCSDIPRPTSAP